MKNLQSLLALGCSIFAIASIAFTEPTERAGGQLADGTPYRVDAEGNQIVDYVAELENSVDQLNRRIGGLESEIEQKQALIEKLSSNNNNSVTTEKSLIGNQTNTAKTVDCPPVSCPEPQVKVEKIVEKVIDPKSSKQLQDTEIRLAKLNQERESVESNLKNELTNRDDIIAEQGAIIERQDAMLASKEEQFKTLQQESIARNAKLIALQGELKNVQAELIQTSSRLPVNAVSKLANASSNDKNSAIPLGAEFKNNTPTRVDEPRASLSLARAKAVDATKAMLNSRISEAKSLMQRRAIVAEKYAKYSNAKVRFTLAKPQSSRGMTLNSISDQMRKAERVSDLVNFRIDVDQIAAKMLEDIALMERMMKVR